MPSSRLCACRVVGLCGCVLGGCDVEVTQDGGAAQHVRGARHMAFTHSQVTKQLQLLALEHPFFSDHRTWPVMGVPPSWDITALIAPYGISPSSAQLQHI